MALRRLVLWRHGETDLNAELRMQGQLDFNLTAKGIGQAQRASPALAALAPERIVTSDLVRAADTAAVLSQATGLPVSEDKRLRETHLGRWQGLTDDEVEAGWPGQLERWRSDPEWAPPGGENRVTAAARALEVVEELDAAGIEVVVLCTHGRLIAGLTPLLLEMPRQNWDVFGGTYNCHWTMLLRQGNRWQLQAHNTAAPV